MQAVYDWEIRKLGGVAGDGLGFHPSIQLHHPSPSTHIVTYLLVCLIAENIVYMFHIDSILIDAPVQEIGGNVIVTHCIVSFMATFQGGIFFFSVRQETHAILEKYLTSSWMIS